MFSPTPLDKDRRLASAIIESSHDKNASGPSEPSGLSPKMEAKYAAKEAKLDAKEAKLDREGAKLESKYRLAGKEKELISKQAKLDQKRAKLNDQRQKLAMHFEAIPKKCKGKNCFVSFGNGKTPGGSVPPHYYSTCGYGHFWNGRGCTQQSTWTYAPPNCSLLATRLKAQGMLLGSLQASAQAACATNTASQDCEDLQNRSSRAELRYRQLQREYSDCRLSALGRFDSLLFP